MTATDHQGDTDREPVGALIEQLRASLAGAGTVLMAHLGDRLGLYQALAEDGPATPAELAEHTGYAERYLQEWLAQQAAVGLVAYERAGGRYALPAEHAPLLAEGESPMSFTGGFEVMAGWYADVDRVADAFRSGRGIAWGEHDPRVHRGTARFFGAAYRASLIDEWVPALGIETVLEHGAVVADIGCGQGVTTVLLASAYPASRFVGVDAHPASIEVARQRAVEASVADRVRFEVAEATGYNGGPFDVIWFFDALHDLGDPTAAAAWAREHLTDDGLLALVEPFAEDDRADNIATNPVAGLHYTASTFLCVPHALSEPGQATLGGQAGGQVLADVLKAGGFTRVDQVATTPIHAVFAAMP